MENFVIFKVFGVLAKLHVNWVVYERKMSVHVLNSVSRRID